MKNRLQQIEKSLGAERFFVLRQMIFVSLEGEKPIR